MSKYLSVQLNGEPVGRLLLVPEAAEKIADPKFCFRLMPVIWRYPGQNDSVVGFDLVSEPLVERKDEDDG